MRFTPSWFSVTMGTGICNSLLFLLPWQSTHTVFRAIGLAFLILDFFLFAVFAAMTLARYFLYPEIFMAMLSHPVHSLFLGTLPMGLVVSTRHRNLQVTTDPITVFALYFHRPSFLALRSKAMHTD